MTTGSMTTNNRQTLNFSRYYLTCATYLYYQQKIKSDKNG